MDILSLEEYEIVPETAPENETPREYILRQTGHDLEYLEGCTWEYIREFPPMQHWFGEFLMRFYKPKILLRKKS